jgi:hypothetical protein
VDKADRHWRAADVQEWWLFRSKKTLIGLLVVVHRNRVCPGFGNRVRPQYIIVPTFAFKTIESTVLNRFRLGQTKPISGTAVGERTVSLDLN